MALNCTLCNNYSVVGISESFEICSLINHIFTTHGVSSKDAMEQTQNSTTYGFSDTSQYQETPHS
jgi:hypothetical protein